MKVNKFFTGVLLAFGLVFSGCGSGGESSSIDSSTMQTGTFIDAKVDGLNYKTPSFESLTDINGSFHYYDGEIIEFSVGGIKIGETKAQKIITPIEICDANNSTDARVLNTLKLLQSIDNDNDPINGIVISNEIRNSAQNLDINLVENPDTNITKLLLTDLLLDSSNIVSDEKALSHFINTLESSPDISDYCEVSSDRFGSIFTTHTDDCQQKKYREAYYNLLFPMFRIAGELSNAKIMSTIDEAELRRQTIEQILNAEKSVQYVKLIRSTSATGVTKEAIDILIGDAADQVGGAMAKSIGSLAGNEMYGDIWYSVLKSYTDAPAAIMGDPEAIKNLVTTQVNSLWQIGSDLLGAWDSNNLTEQNNELVLTQYVLEYYYSNLTDTIKLMQVLELTGDFNWDKVVEKVATIKGYENGLLSEEYTTSKIVDQVTSYIRLIETTVDIDISSDLEVLLTEKTIYGNCGNYIEEITFQTDGKVKIQKESDLFFNDYVIADNVLITTDEDGDKYHTYKTSTSEYIRFIEPNTEISTFYFNQVDAHNTPVNNCEDDGHIADSLSLNWSGKVVVKDSNGDIQPILPNTVVRITPNEEQIIDNWGGVEATVDSNGNWFIDSVSSSLRVDISHYTSSNKYQFIVSSNGEMYQFYSCGDNYLRDYKPVTSRATISDFTTTIELTSSEQCVDSGLDFSSMGSNSTALNYPNGGEEWIHDTGETILWDKNKITGVSVDMYVLSDDPTYLTNYDSLNDLLVNIDWYKFLNAEINSGSYTIDPVQLRGAGNVHVILIVGSDGSWDISNSVFSIQ